MFEFYNDRSPKILYDSLTKLESVHDHSTEQLTKIVYFKRPVNNNIGRERDYIIQGRESMGRMRYDY